MSKYLETNISCNLRYHYYEYSPCVQSFKCNQPGQIYGVAIDGMFSVVLFFTVKCCNRSELKSAFPYNVYTFRFTLRDFV